MVMLIGAVNSLQNCDCCFWLQYRLLKWLFALSLTRSKAEFLFYMLTALSRFSNKVMSLCWVLWSSRWSLRETLKGVMRAFMLSTHASESTSLSPFFSLLSYVCVFSSFSLCYVISFAALLLFFSFFFSLIGRAVLNTYFHE